MHHHRREVVLDGILGECAALYGKAWQRIKTTWQVYFESFDTNGIKYSSAQYYIQDETIKTKLYQAYNDGDGGRNFPSYYIAGIGFRQRFAQ